MDSFPILSRSARLDLLLAACSCVSGTTPSCGKVSRLEASLALGLFRGARIIVLEPGTSGAPVLSRGSKRADLALSILSSASLNSFPLSDFLSFGPALLVQTIGRPELQLSSTYTVDSSPMLLEFSSLSLSLSLKANSVDFLLAAHGNCLGAGTSCANSLHIGALPLPQSLSQVGPLFSSFSCGRSGVPVLVPDFVLSGSFLPIDLNPFGPVLLIEGLVSPAPSIPSQGFQCLDVLLLLAAVNVGSFGGKGVHVEAALLVRGTACLDFALLAFGLQVGAPLILQRVAWVDLLASTTAFACGSATILRSSGCPDLSMPLLGGYLGLASTCEFARAGAPLPLQSLAQIGFFLLAHALVLGSQLPSQGFHRMGPTVSGCDRVHLDTVLPLRAAMCLGAASSFANHAAAGSNLVTRTLARLVLILPVLGFPQSDSSLLLRNSAHAEAVAPVLGTARVGFLFRLPVPNIAQSGLLMLLRGSAQADTLLFALCCAQPESPSIVRTHQCPGLSALALAARLGAPLSALSVANVGVAAVMRSLLRIGTAFAAADVVHVEFSILLHSFSHAALAVLSPDVSRPDSIPLLQHFCRSEALIPPLGMACIEPLCALFVQESNLEALALLKSTCCSDVSAPASDPSAVDLPMLTRHPFSDAFPLVAGLARLSLIFALSAFDGTRLDFSLSARSLHCLEASLMLVASQQLGSCLPLQAMVRAELAPMFGGSPRLDMLLLSNGFVAHSDSALPSRSISRPGGITFAPNCARAATPLFLQAATCLGLPLLTANAGFGAFSFLQTSARVGLILSAARTGHVGFTLASRAPARFGSLVPALDPLQTDPLLPLRALARSSSSLAASAQVSCGKKVVSADGQVRAEVTEQGGFFKGDWALPGALAYSVSSFAYVGMMALLDSYSLGPAAPIQRHNCLAFSSPTCNSFCSGETLLSLDFASLGLSLLVQSPSRGFAPLVWELAAVEFLLSLHAPFCLDLPTSCGGLSRADSVFALFAVDVSQLDFSFLAKALA